MIKKYSLFIQSCACVKKILVLTNTSTFQCFIQILERCSSDEMDYFDMKHG